MRTSSTPFSLSPAFQSLSVEVLGWTSQPEYLSELMNWIPHHHHPVAIPARIQGPTPPGTIRLILGRSGLTLKGLQILPGLIDPNYSGKIKVMAHSLIHSMSFLKVRELLSSFSCLTMPLATIILSPEENKDLGAQVIK